MKIVHTGPELRAAGLARYVRVSERLHQQSRRSRARVVLCAGIAVITLLVIVTFLRGGQ